MCKFHVGDKVIAKQDIFAIQKRVKAGTQLEITGLITGGNRITYIVQDKDGEKIFGVWDEDLEYY